MRRQVCVGVVKPLLWGWGGGGWGSRPAKVGRGGGKRGGGGGKCVAVGASLGNVSVYNLGPVLVPGMGKGSGGKGGVGGKVKVGKKAFRRQYGTRHSRGGWRTYWNAVCGVGKEKAVGNAKIRLRMSEFVWKVVE